MERCADRPFQSCQSMNAPLIPQYISVVFQAIMLDWRNNVAKNRI